MREIDINRLLSQLGLSTVDFMKWQSDEENRADVEETCIIETPVEKLADLSDGSSMELAF
ncbi:hypothetical protein ACFQZT_24635 [Paenibacillus sp. GCM10027628]|uniref:hypothetical protein n=1 Tax=Paenibacillus sp. GCM10027628 TaxID=3273413 RepID=UPI00362D9657